MKDFNLHFKNGKKEFKLDITGIDQVEELKIIAEMVKSLNINMRNQTDFIEKDKIEACTPASLKALEAGYQVLTKEEPKPMDKKPLQTITLNRLEVEVKSPLPEMEKADTVFSKAFEAAQINSRQVEWIDIQKFETEWNVRYFGNDNEPHYQTYYICPTCGNRGKRFIKKEHTGVRCHSCNHLMSVRNADERGFPQTDVFDNFFVAGSFGNPESLTY